MAGHKGTLTAETKYIVSQMIEQSGFRNIQEYKAMQELASADCRITNLQFDIQEHKEWLENNASKLNAEDLAEEMETLESNRLELLKQIERKANAENALQASKEMPEQFGLIRNHI